MGKRTVKNVHTKFMPMRNTGKARKSKANISGWRDERNIVYAAVCIFIYGRLVCLGFDTEKQKPAKILTEEIMKKNVVVVEEKGRIFWFCGSCGRPLAKTKKNELVCPRGHIKSAMEYRKERMDKERVQMEFDFTNKPRESQKSRKRLVKGA